MSQLVEGERLDSSGLADEQAVRAIAAVCDALAYAHARGIVHRDVKPANILVVRDGTVHLTDFGIASDEDARDQTVDERVLGTLSYMAPEQAAGTRATGATDVWAAGLTLYAQLTGANPYKAKTLAQLLEKLAAGAEPLADGAPDLPTASAGPSIARSTTIPRGGRTAGEMRDRLLRGLAEADVRGRARPMRAWAAPANWHRNARPNGTPPQRPRRRPGAALLSALAVAWVAGRVPGVSRRRGRSRWRCSPACSRTGARSRRRRSRASCASRRSGTTPRRRASCGRACARPGSGRGRSGAGRHGSWRRSRPSRSA